MLGALGVGFGRTPLFISTKCFLHMLAAQVLYSGCDLAKVSVATQKIPMTLCFVVQTTINTSQLVLLILLLLCILLRLEPNTQVINASLLEDVHFLHGQITFDIGFKVSYS